MPMYTHECTMCSKRVDILRPFDQQSPPTVEEGGLCTVADERAGVELHVWTKIIHAPKMVRGPSWRGSKGNW